MKDKLRKNGRKGTFYKARKVFIATLLIASGAAGITVASLISAAGNVKAEQEQKESISEINSDDIVGSETILLY